MFNYQRVSLMYNGNVGVFARYEKNQSSDAPKVSFPSVFGQTLNTLLKNYRCGKLFSKTRFVLGGYPVYIIRFANILPYGSSPTFSESIWIHRDHNFVVICMCIGRHARTGPVI